MIAGGAAGTAGEGYRDFRAQIVVGPMIPATLPLEPFTEEQAEALARFELAPDAPESFANVERVAAAMAAVVGGVASSLTRRMAVAAIGALVGPVSET